MPLFAVLSRNKLRRALPVCILQLGWVRGWGGVGGSEIGTHPFSPAAQECPCEVDLELLSLLRNVSVMPAVSPAPRDSGGQNLRLGAQLQPGDGLTHECSAW